MTNILKGKKIYIYIYMQDSINGDKLEISLSLVFLRATYYLLFILPGALKIDEEADEETDIYCRK